MTAPSPGGVQRWTALPAIMACGISELVPCPRGFWVMYRDYETTVGKLVVEWRSVALGLSTENEGLRVALEDFIKFGRPKEGSDKYKAAWDGLSEALRGAAGEVRQ